jgi:glucose-1-phosphate cytidylyltransferase
LIELKGDVVRSFKEKPMLSGYINGGFYVFNRAIFKYLKEDSTLEEEVMRKLVREKQLIAYKHTGFWACMDTYKDVSRLNTLWKTGVLPNVGVKIGKPRKPPWKVWND